MKHLTIISHTEHYFTSEGNIVGLGSTVTEINHLLEIFETITHIAMLHKSAPPPNAIPYHSNKINFVAMPALGGKNLTDKWSIIRNIPKILNLVRRHTAKSDYFQFRAPTGIGVFVIPFLMLSSKNGWFKYAGNWKQENAPLAYRFQKWLLQHQSKKVTINGFWKDQPTHCISFENPCLTLTELTEGKAYVANKSYALPLNFCFVGRLEQAKGLDLIIESLSQLTEVEKGKIGLVHIVGEGPKKQHYELKAKSAGVQFKFHGTLSRLQVMEIYKQSEVMLLPSASEGFPKVIAEAINYGCIPLISKVSAIDQYIKNGQNGLLFKSLSQNHVQETIRQLLSLTAKELTDMTIAREAFVEKFSFMHYNEHLIKEIL